MLHHPSYDKLIRLKLFGMARAFAEQSALNLGHLDLDERLGLLVDHETTERDGKALALRLQRAKLKPRKLGGNSPDVIILFASPEFDYVKLLEAIELGCKPKIMVGCSSAGEFSGCKDSNASASLMAIRGEDIHFNAILGTGLRVAPSAAVDQLMSVFTGAEHSEFRTGAR